MQRSGFNFMEVCCVWNRWKSTQAFKGKDQRTDQHRRLRGRNLLQAAACRSRRSKKEAFFHQLDHRPWCSRAVLTTLGSGGKATGLGAGSPGDFWNVADNFLVQVVDESAREGTLLDLSLMNKEEAIRELKAAGNLGCSAQEMVKFKKLSGVQDK